MKQAKQGTAEQWAESVFKIISGFLEFWLNLWLKFVDYFFANQLRFLRDTGNQLGGVMQNSGLKNFLRLSRYCVICGATVFGVISSFILALLFYLAFYWLVMPSNIIETQLMLQKGPNGFIGVANVSDCTNLYIQKHLCELIENEQYNISLGITLEKRTLNNFPVRLDIDFASDLKPFSTEDIINLRNHATLWYYAQMVLAFFLPFYSFNPNQYVELPLAHNISNLKGQITTITVQIRQVSSILQSATLKLQTVLLGYRYYMKHWFFSSLLVAVAINFSVLFTGYVIIAVIVWKLSRRLCVRLLNSNEGLVSQQMRNVLLEEFGGVKTKND